MTYIKTIEVRLPTNNPWIQGPEIEVDYAEAERIANLLAAACEAQRDNETISASYHYNDYVVPILSAEMPQGKQDRLTMKRAVVTVLYEMQNRFDWRDGANAARRVVECGVAYDTPGFIKAYANHCRENN